MNWFQYGLCNDVKDLLLTMPNLSTLSQEIAQIDPCYNRFLMLIRKALGVTNNPEIFYTCYVISINNIYIKG
jgi:hypothetical protein